MAQGEGDDDDKAPRRPNLRALPLPDPPNGAPRPLGRRAEAVLAVTVGFLTLKQACRQYGMTEDEFLACEETIKQHGWLALQDPDLPPNNGSLMK